MEELQTFHETDIILVCGLYGAGKSQFSKKFFVETGRLRVNRNEIRKMLYEMIHFGKPWSAQSYSEVDENLVKHTERKIIEQLLFDNRKILIDNTSVTRKSRAQYISLAHQSMDTIGVIFLNTPLGKCLERNKQNPQGVPPTVITNQSQQLELPEDTEGFEEVLILDDF